MNVEMNENLKPKTKKEPREIKEVSESSELLDQLIIKANDKEFGKKVSSKKIIDFALSKLTDKDIETLKDQSMSSEDILRKEHKLYNEKHGKDLKFFDFIAMKTKLKIQ